MDNKVNNNNSEQFHVVMDGTVVKPPYTGVQNSVQHEIAAELKALKWKITAVLALTDSPLRDLTSDYHCLYFETRFATGGVWRRILWQQTMLPRLLRKIHADVFHAFQRPDVVVSVIDVIYVFCRHIH